MHPTRRQLLKSASSGFGYLAFSALATQRALAEATGAPHPLAPTAPHFPGTAKRVIMLSMRGGPSHLDTFDYKPKLKEHSGRETDLSPRGGKLLGTPFEFSQHGDSGLWVSELFPELAKHADDLCMLHGMNTDIPNHPQAQLQMTTGSFQFVRPSMGAWTLYGLGTENENLPGFITINPGNASPQGYGSAFLPAIYQGTKLNAPGGNGRAAAIRRFLGQEQGDGSPVPNIKNTTLSRDLQRTQLDLIRSLDRDKLARDEHAPEIEGAIGSFELAFRMQDEVPQIMDIASESKATQDLYGIGNGLADGFGRQCLMARRLAEAGVRFIEVSGGGNWDHHRNLTAGIRNSSSQIDQPIAGLLADLKSRDLLKDTLVIWSGEFGRTPYAQGTDGRDHNHRGYTSWMAGGGVKGGLAHGSTDDYGHAAVEGRMHIHDWHATVLHLLGLDHTRLTFNYAGRDFRLTDVHGNVAREILA